jgi:hypothetical protein
MEDFRDAHLRRQRLALQKQFQVLEAVPNFAGKDPAADKVEDAAERFPSMRSWHRVAANERSIHGPLTIFTAATSGLSKLT